MEKKYTAVIILNYNNYEDTINCIDSVEKYNTAPIKYIIVDNGSTRKGVTEKLDSYLSSRFHSNYKKYNEGDGSSTLPYVSFLISQTNDGYARGNNKGLQLAYADNSIKSLLILNNDVLFVENIIPELIYSYYNELNDVAILSPILYKKDLRGIDYNCARKNETIWEATKKNLLHYYYLITKKSHLQISPNRYLLLNGIPNTKFIKTELPSGSCMFIDKSLFYQIDSFDPNTFLYWEENILFKKVEKIHKTNYICTNLRCVHLGAASTSSSPSLFIVKCGINSQLYYMKYYSGCSKFAYYIFKISCLIYKSLYMLQKKICK